MTSLQHQLSAIRAQSTQELNLRAQRVAHSKSLVFPPAEAATQSIFDIYQICVRSFKEICSLDNRFSQFAGSLFGEESLDVERTQLSKEMNDTLDRNLENLMALLAPRLQLRDAVFVLEWLVRRFRVHEYNTTALVLNLLPFHETPTFVSMLELIPPGKLAGPFEFILTYQAAKSSFKRPILVREATRHPAILSFISQHVREVASRGIQSEVLVSFWLDVAVQTTNGLLDHARSGRHAVQGMKQDEVILQLTSVIHDNLQIREYPDLTVACYTLATVMAHKATLDDTWVDAMMASVSNTMNAANEQACLACLAVLAEKRSATRNRLPGVILRSLDRISPRIPDHLLTLSPFLNVQRLAYGICLAYLEAWKRSKYRNGLSAVDKIIREGPLSGSKKRSFLAKAMHALHEMSSETAASSELKEDLNRLLISWAKDRDLAVLFGKAVAASKLELGALPVNLQAEIVDSSSGTEHHAGKSGDMERESSGDLILDIDESALAKVSFFTTETPDLFVTLRANLARMPSASLGGSHLKAERPFQSMDESGYLTFLVKTWCSRNSPLRARLNALSAVETFLNGLESTKCDPQILIPFLLCAFGDQDRRVREQAAESVRNLMAFYESENIKSTSRRKVILSTAVDVESVSSKDVKSFLKSLQTHIESCVLDPNQVFTTVTRILSGHSDQLNSGRSKDGKELKSVTRSSLSLLLAGCAVNSTLLPVQLTISSMLKDSGKSTSPARSKYLLPALESWISLASGTAKSLAVLDDYSLPEIDQKLLESVVTKNDASFHILETILDGTTGQHRSDIQGPAFQVCQDMFRRREAPEGLVTKLFTVASDRENTDDPTGRRTSARECFLAVRSSATELSSLLSSLPSASRLPDQPSASKRRRVSKSAGGRRDINVQDTSDNDLRQYTLALEKVEASNYKDPVLLKSLFRVLSELMHFESQVDSKLDYLIQITIRATNAVIDELIAQQSPQDSKIYQSAIRMDTLVECLRNSSGRGIQNDVLLLISKLATWDPELVLHSVMPIFTFMGASTLRQGDDYSAHVINCTIETVIPPLTTSLSKKKSVAINSISEILLSFTAAFEHIPSHRRLDLFKLLIQKLGVDESLFAVIAMLVDRHGRSQVVRSFIVELVSTFGPQTELFAIKRGFDLLVDVHAPNAFVKSRTFSEPVLNLKDKTNSQVEELVRHLLVAYSQLLARPELRRRLIRTLSESGKYDSGRGKPTESIHADLLSQSINLCQILAKKRSDVSKEAKNSLASVLKVLDVDSMVTAISGILESSTDDMKVIAISALQEQVGIVPKDDHKAVSSLLEFTTSLCHTLQSSQEVQVKEVTISCIDQIAERFGKKDPSVIIVAAEVLASESILGRFEISVGVPALFTLASMVDVLRDDFVPLIPSVVTQAFAVLELSAGQERFDELRSSVFATINAVLECLPQMLSSDDIDKAIRLCHRSAAGMPILDRTTDRQQFYNLASSKLETRTCFEAVDRNVQYAIEQGFSACQEHIRFTHAIVQRHSKRAARDHSSSIFHIVQELLDIRRRSKAEPAIGQIYTDDHIRNIEALTVDMAVTTINNLNDESFRPHFANLVDWATASLPVQPADGSLHRATSFFVLLRRLVEVLKSLVTGYTSYYLPLAAEILQTTSPTTSATVELLHAVLDSLSLNFTTDEGDYWQNRSHFDPVAKPVIGQLAQFALANQSPTLHVIPAISSLVLAGYSSDKRAEVNMEILKLLRHEDARLRLAAIQCQRHLLAQVGDEWVTMVSQMLPFINEAQEDGNEEVERETRRWIKELEEALGESMAAMLQ